MKDIVRQRTSLSEEIEQILNEQVKKEAEACAIYLAMASWCDSHGFLGSAKFFYKQSDEEREHMLRLFKYINDTGVRAYSPPISDINQEFDSLRATFEQGLEQEISNTQSINHVVDRSYKAKDYATAEFMQWYVKEQVEEEYIFRRAFELFDIMGNDGLALYTIDKKIPDIKFKE
jgi:ferritin